MELDMHTRKKLSNTIAKRYRSASKKEKGRILEEFVASTGYNRDYAAHLLSNWGRSHYLSFEEEEIRLVTGRRQKCVKKHAGEGLAPTMKRLSGHYEPSGNSWVTPAANYSLR